MIVFTSPGLSGPLRPVANDYIRSPDDVSDEYDVGWDLDDHDNSDDEDDVDDDAYQSMNPVDDGVVNPVPTHNDLLLIVVGVVVGVVVISLILIVVACVWRQRKQRLQRPLSKS